jgi:hypothetical protein
MLSIALSAGGGYEVARAIMLFDDSRANEQSVACENGRSMTGFECDDSVWNDFGAKHPTQLPSRPDQQTLHATRRGLQLPGNFDITALAELLQDDCRLLALGETIDGGTHTSPALLTDQA